MQKQMLINRILIVGSGSIGILHLQLARESFPDAEILILSHRPHSENLPEANGRVYTISEALSFKPQLAVIANPASEHVRIALPLAKAGIHLLIEKPLAVNYTECIQLLDLSLRPGQIVQVAYNLRFLPSLQQFRKYLIGDLIGRVLAVRCEVGQFLPDWRPGRDYRDSVSARKSLGGGVMLELSHEIDYLSWIFGRVESVSAMLSQESDLDIDAEDTANLLLSFRAEPESRSVQASVCLDFVRRDATRRCIAIGAQGTLEWDGRNGMVRHYDPSTGDWRSKFEFKHDRIYSYRQEWAQFLDAISTGVLTTNTIVEGSAVIAIIDAARISSETGRRVQLPINNFSAMQ